MFKKILSVMLATVLCITTVACASEPTPAPNLPAPEAKLASIPQHFVPMAKVAEKETTGKPSAELVPSGMLPQNPTPEFKDFIEEAGEENVIFYFAPEIIYSTTAEDNEMYGMLTVAIATVVEIDNDSYEQSLALLETEYGYLVLFNDPEWAYSQNLDWDSMEVGNEYAFFFYYIDTEETSQLVLGYFLNCDTIEEEDIES